jgi:hypothetical protein
MAVKSRTITHGLKYSLATGNWGPSSQQSSKVGVAQVLNRLTFASTLSHLRRLNSPIGREGKKIFYTPFHSFGTNILIFQSINIFFFRKARKAKTIAQYSLGYDMPSRNARGSSLWVGQKFSIDGLHIRWIIFGSHIGIFGGMVYGKSRGNFSIHHSICNKDLCEWSMGWYP